MSERKVKLVSMKEAVSYISDGDRIAFGGWAVYQKPMAVTHEIIRAGKKNLTIVGSLNSFEADMLIGAGCLKTIETSYVGLEKYGLAQNFRRRVQDGTLEVVHYPEMLSWDRFRADREGLDFWPAHSMSGSDIVNTNPAIKEFRCPITGKILHAIPAAKPDVAVIHAYAGDKYGNIQMQENRLMPQSKDMVIARSCKKIIVTIEKLIDTEELRKAPQLTAIPSFKTTCVVHVPNGSHPTPVLTVNHADDAFIRKYVEASKTDETFKAFLDKYIYGTGSFEEYYSLVKKEEQED